MKAILTILLAATPVLETDAEAPGRFTPFLSTTFGSYSERLEIGDLGATDESRLNSGLLLGVDYGVSDSVGAGLTLGGRSALAWVFVYDTAEWQLGLEQQIRVSREITSELFLFAGGSASLWLNVSRAGQSQIALRVPIGIRFFDVEISYLPGYVLGLGSDESDVFGGERSLSVASGFSPFFLEVGYRFKGLSL